MHKQKNMDTNIYNIIIHNIQIRKESTNRELYKNL